MQIELEISSRLALLFFTIPENYFLTSDLNITESTANSIKLSGKNRNNFSLYIDKKSEFSSFKSNEIEVQTDLKNTKIDDIQKAILNLLNFQ